MDYQAYNRPQGEIIHMGSLFAITRTDFPDSGKMHPNVTIWMEDDENWFRVTDFDPAWLTDLQDCIAKAVADFREKE